MKAMLVLDCRGWGMARGLRPIPGVRGVLVRERAKAAWPRVWEISDERQEVSPVVGDYRGASRSFDTGVRLRFVLESGKLYEVRAQTSWRGRETYRCFVTPEGDIHRVEA